MLENYEVITGAFHHSWCFTTQIKGGLNDLLSSNWRLPNYVYILFSNDQLDDCDILGDQIFNVLENCFTAVNRALIQRRFNLPKKAKRYKPTTVVVVKTVAKNESQMKENNFKLRRRSFNRALQKTSAELKWKAVNVDAIIPNQEDNFDEKGNNLSDRGFELYWNFLSEDLQCMDEGRADSINSAYKQQQRTSLTKEQNRHGYYKWKY